ncbi:AAA family ATPase [Actinomadura sp. LD22]|uniref:AAA family ATPase n=1 Tax=Actinomadura physcomitrii TaxID=2650748 RepID=A0A6I4MM32_9ACTN|nr:ParA family protein [Actinomadura physcomitrii]MWA07258.1 AAA family ATPase [Actinomadura physcomitrii]
MSATVTRAASDRIAARLATRFHGLVSADTGERVLIVDYDSQGHLTNQFGVPQIASGEDSLAKHMAGEAKGQIGELIVALPDERTGGRLHVLPACADGFLMDFRLSQARAREAALERALAPVEDDYDVTIVDSGWPSFLFRRGAGGSRSRGRLLDGSDFDQDLLDLWNVDAMRRRSALNAVVASRTKFATWTAERRTSSECPPQSITHTCSSADSNSV